MAQTIFGLPVSGLVQSEEGSPWMRVFTYALATASLWVLSQRQVDLSEIVSNEWVAQSLFFLLFHFRRLV